MAAKGSIKISEELFGLLVLSVKMGETSQGAFDITFASVGYLYNYRDKKRPDDTQVEALLDAIDYRLIELDPATFSVRFKHPNVKIDLGGIAKGHAVDNGIVILHEYGIKHGLVTAAEDTRLLRARRGHPGWQGFSVLLQTELPSH